MNYKCVVALKTKINCKCQVKIGEITKIIELPNQESQFFDIQHIPDFISIDFLNFGILSIPITKQDTDEIEITDSFQLKDLKGKYYILFILAKNAKFEENQQLQSPLKHYLKSYHRRNKERQQKVKTQQLIKSSFNSTKQNNVNELQKKQYETIKEENKLLKLRERNDYLNELEISQSKRKELQNFISQLSEEQTKQQQLLQEKNKQYEELLIDQQNKLDELLIYQQKDQLKIQQLENQLKDNQQQFKQLNILHEGNNEQQTLCQLLAKQKQDLELLLQKLTTQYEKNLKEKIQENNKLKQIQDKQIQDLNNYQQHILDLKQQIQQIEQQLEGSNNYINQLKLKLQIEEQKNQAMKIYELLKNESDNQILEKEKIIKDLEHNIQLLQKQISYQSLHLNDELEKDIKILKEQQQLDKDIINNLQLENLKLLTENAKIPGLIQSIKSLQIKYQVIEFPDMKIINDKIEKYRNQINAQLQELNNLRQQLSEITQKDYDKEIQNTQLKTMMSQIVESNQAYIPVKEDSLDQQIAQFINSKSNKDTYIHSLKRQSEGVYLYGSKRIFIKQENGKILIRSGGGYLTIEEFLGLHEAKLRDETSDVIKRQAIKKKTERLKTIN